MSAGPVGPELRSGKTEESLARMHQCDEMPTSSGVHEMYHIPETLEMPNSFNYKNTDYYEIAELPERPGLYKPLPDIPQPVIEEVEEIRCRSDTEADRGPKGVRTVYERVIGKLG